MVVEAGDDVGAAADERLERLGAAREILQLDVESLFAVEPELLRERRRQVDHLILATNGHAYVRPVRGAAPARADGDKDTKENRGHRGKHGGRKETKNTKERTAL